VNAIKVTTPDDGQLLNRGYSYWSQAWVDGDDVLCFVGHTDNWPRFYRVNLRSGAIERLGALLPYSSTGEGWYLDHAGCLYLTVDAQLLRVNPLGGEATVVMAVSDDRYRLWQAHSSDDGQTHCATVQRVTSDGPYHNETTLVKTPTNVTAFATRGALDESQVTSDGAYLVIKEDDDNRIIELSTGTERLLTDADGAVGHSDVGPSLLVGEDNIRGACVAWDLTRDLTLQNQKHLFGTWNMGHVSIRAGRCLHSDETSLNLVNLDGSGVTRLLDHGMVGSGYDYQCMANLSPCGRVAAWVSNAAGRFDLYLGEV
jgi:hypothetical protein